LNLLTLQQLGQVRVGQHRLGQVVVGFQLGGLTPSAVEGVQFGDGGLGPNAEPADVSSGGQRAKVQLFDVHQRDAGNVTECFTNAVVSAVDDARSSAHDAAAIAHFTLASAESFAIADFLHVFPSVDLAQQSDGLLRLLQGLDLVVNDQRNFGDLLDLVSFRHDQSRYSSGCDGAAHGVSFLVGVDAMMPTTPSLGRGEHSTTATHVTERTLAGSVRASSSDSGDPSHCSAGSPRSCRGLFSGSDVDAVSLTRILHHFVVDERNDVGTDRGLEDGGEVDAFASLWG